MRRYGLWIDGEIAMQRVVEALRDRGIHVHCRNGLMLADLVPGIVRRDALESGAPVVVPISRKRSKS